MVKFPCKICTKDVASNHRVIQCDICNIWVHIKCNKINSQTYDLLRKVNTQWFCIECSKDQFPLSKLNNNEFHHTILGEKIKLLPTAKRNFGSENALIDRLNNVLNDFDIPNSSTYFGIKEFNDAFDSKIFTGLNLFHLNISSLTYNFDQLHTLLAGLDIKFNVLGITETETELNVYQYI